MRPRRYDVHCSVAGCAGCNNAGHPATARGIQAGGRARRREPLAVYAADGGSDFQLRRARLSRNGDVALSGRSASPQRVHGARGGRRHPDRMGGDVGTGQAGHLPRLRHRRHPASVAKTGSRVPCADDRRRAGAWRGTQLGTGGQHHGGARREADHDARPSPRHDPDLARRRGRAGRDQGVLRP